MAARKGDKYQILASTPSFMEFEVTKCSIYDMIGKLGGNDLAGKMLCRYGCILSTETLFKLLGFKVEIIRHAEMAKDGKCKMEIKLVKD